MLEGQEVLVKTFVRFFFMVSLSLPLPAAEEDLGFKTSYSFQPGVVLHGEHAEPYMVMGFDTNQAPVFLWTGFGYTIKVDEADDSATAAYYPWLTTVLAVTLFSNASGDSFIRPQLTIPWSTLTYQVPGLGINVQKTVPVDWSRLGPTGFVFQGEVNFFPGLLDNPWYEEASAAGVNVGRKYWKMTYGGMIKYYYKDRYIDFQARFVTDNYAYDVEGRYTTITNTDWFLTVGMKGLAVRGGITTNGWNYSRDGGKLVPDLLPNFSLLLFP